MEQENDVRMVEGKQPYKKKLNQCYNELELKGSDFSVGVGYL